MKTKNKRHLRKYSQAIKNARKWLATRFHKRRYIKWVKAAAKAGKAIDRAGFKTY